jgi:hypothetical protein
MTSNLKTIITGFTNIVTTANQDIGAMTGGAPITVLADENSIFNAANEVSSFVFFRWKNIKRLNL